VRLDETVFRPNVKTETPDPRMTPECQ